jgi:hypothetical protein
MTDIAEVRKALEEALRAKKWSHCLSYIHDALAAFDRLERSAAPDGKHWRHVNSGALVTEIGRGLYASGDGVDDVTPIVFYRHDIGGWGSAFWARPIKEFEDGQFVEVPPTPAQTEEGKA